MAEEHKQAKGSLAEPGPKHDGHGHGPHHGMHIKKLHDGYHVHRFHPDGTETEHAASNLDEVHDHVHEHFLPAEEAAVEGGGGPGEGEAAAGGAAGAGAGAGSGAGTAGEMA